METAKYWYLRAIILTGFHWGKIQQYHGLHQCQQQFPWYPDTEIDNVTHLKD